MNNLKQPIYIELPYKLDSLYTRIGLVLTILNEGAYLTIKSTFQKALNLFKFDCEITLESIPGTN